MTLTVQPVGMDYVAQTLALCRNIFEGGVRKKGEPVPEWMNNDDLSHVQGFFDFGLMDVVSCYR